MSTASHSARTCPGHRLLLGQSRRPNSYEPNMKAIDEAVMRALYYTNVDCCTVHNSPRCRRTLLLTTQVYDSYWLIRAMASHK